MDDAEGNRLLKNPEELQRLKISARNDVYAWIKLEQFKNWLSTKPRIQTPPPTTEGTGLEPEVASDLEQAKKGDASAQYRFGKRCEYGTGVKKGVVTAAYWYRKSAEQWYSDAWLALCRMAENGHNAARTELNRLTNHIRQQSNLTKKSHQNITKTLRELAEKDHSQALNILCQLTEQQYQGALQELCHLAKQENVEAQYELAQLYEKGLGVSQDSASAARWYAKATLQGHIKSFKSLCSMTEQGDKYALNELCCLAKLDNVEAQYELAQLYEKGLGVPQDSASATKWYAQAAMRGHTQSFKALCLMTEQGDKNALQELCHLAEQENVEAQYELAQLYEKGLGVSQDDTLAIRWYSKAAMQGHVQSLQALKLFAENEYSEGQYELAKLYENGLGVSRNYISAVKWYKKAAMQGHTESLQALNRMAERGRSEALYELAQLYQKGLGVPQDNELAVKLYAKAALKNHTKSFKALCLMIEEGDQGALQVICHLAEQENVEAQYKLAQLYEKGLSVSQDDTLAIKWYSKAAMQGHAQSLRALKQFAENEYSEGQYELAKLYENGLGVSRNYKTAVKWYIKAAMQGHTQSLQTLNLMAEQGRSEALYELAQLYQKGLGVPQDNELAVKLYAKAALKNHTKSFEALCLMIEEGDQGALQEIFHLAEQNNAEAQYKLAHLYENGGNGIQQDNEQAVEWYCKAATQGHTEAIQTLWMFIEHDHEKSLQMLQILDKLGDEKARERIRKMAEQGNVEAIDEVAKRAQQGDEEAIQTLRIMAGQGNADAFYQLGYMYQHGFGVRQYDNLAVDCYFKAAQKDHQQALEELRNMAEQGHKKAQAMLERLGN